MDLNRGQGRYESIEPPTARSGRNLSVPFQYLTGGRTHKSLLEIVRMTQKNTFGKSVPAASFCAALPNKALQTLQRFAYLAALLHLCSRK